MAQIDHSIYFQQETPDIVGSIQRGLSMRDMVDRRNLRKKQQEQQEQIKQSMKNNLMQGDDGSTTLNKKAYLSDLYKIAPEKAYETQKQFKAEDIQDRQQKLVDAKNKIEMSARLLGSVKDQQSYDRAVNKAIELGLADPGEMPQQYDPSFVNSTLMQTLSVKDKIDQQWKQKEFGLKQDELDYKKQKYQAEAKGANADLATKLRKERSGLDTTKATQNVSAAYNKVQNAAKNPTAAGDLSLIFNYMKMLDPGSVVREGEFANAQNAAGVPDRIRNYYNRVQEGLRLSENQRNDFLNQAEGVYKAQTSIQDQIDKQYADYAQKLGVDPNEVLLNFRAQQPQKEQNQKTWGSSLGVNEAVAEEQNVFSGDEIDWAD